jgi:hypothetical protein
MLRQEPIVTVATFSSSMEASLARGALEAIGIRAWVPGEAQGSFLSMYRGGLSTTELKVFESDRDRALVELSRMQIRLVE